MGAFRECFSIYPCSQWKKASALKIGYVGLGRMGSGMAMNLFTKGADLTVYDASPGAREQFANEGVQVAESLGQLVRGVDVLFMSLPGPREIGAVVYDDNGLLANAKADQVVVDLSTSSRSMTQTVHDDLAQRGVHMLDAPVSGGPAGARSGDMAFWVGGNREIYNRCLPILKLMGDKPFHVGPIGSGTVVKLANNMTGYSIMLTLAETFSAATKAGVDPLVLWEALRLGVVGKSSPLDMLKAQFLPGDYEPPAFALRLALKDVLLATEMGRDLGVPMRACNLTLGEMTEAVTKGMGDQDSRSYLKLQLERAGVEIAVDKQRLADAFSRL